MIGLTSQGSEFEDCIKGLSCNCCNIVLLRGFCCSTELGNKFRCDGNILQIKMYLIMIIGPPNVDHCLQMFLSLSLLYLFNDKYLLTKFGLIFFTINVPTKCYYILKLKVY